MDSATTRNSLVLIAAVAVGAALYWLSEILTPLVLAIFLMFMIDGLARIVRRYLPILPEGAALPLSLVLIILAFLGSVWLIIDGFAGFASQVQTFSERINVVIGDIAALVNYEAAPTLEELIARLDLQKYMGSAATAVARGVQGIAADAFFVLVYLGFLIASRDGFRRKVVVLFPERDDRKEAVHVFDRVRSGVEGYIWVQTVTGLMIAGGCWAVMAAVGLENALFWAFLIFLLSYIPIIGGAVAGLAPAAFALVQFDSYWQAIVLFGVIQAWLFIVGNLVLPKMQADDQNIDPVVVLLSLAFWGAIWGVTGAFLSTPLTVMAMAVMAEFKGSRWIAVLLSGDGDPYPEEDPPLADNPPKPAPNPPVRKRAAKA